MGQAHASAQVPAERGDAAYRVGTGPLSAPRDPRGALGKGGFGRLLFLGRKLFLKLPSEIGNPGCLPGVPPRVPPLAIKRRCPLSRLKIKTPTQEPPRLGGGAEAAGWGLGGGGVSSLWALRPVTALPGL